MRETLSGDFRSAMLGHRFETPGTAIILAPRLAESLDDAEALRVIRNTCRETMTFSTAEISAAEQRAWWGTFQRHMMRIWLFDAPDGTPVGFGLIKSDGGLYPTGPVRFWATLGLLPEWRGQGHGVAIYRHLIANCPADLWVDVLLTNSRSARAAERAGFLLADWNGAIATLVARKGER